MRQGLEGFHLLSSLSTHMQGDTVSRLGVSGARINSVMQLTRPGTGWKLVPDGYCPF